MLNIPNIKGKMLLLSTDAAARSLATQANTLRAYMASFIYPSDVKDMPKKVVPLKYMMNLAECLIEDDFVPCVNDIQNLDCDEFTKRTLSVMYDTFCAMIEAHKEALHEWIPGVGPGICSLPTELDPSVTLAPPKKPGCLAHIPDSAVISVKTDAELSDISKRKPISPFDIVMGVGRKVMEQHLSYTLYDTVCETIPRLSYTSYDIARSTVPRTTVPWSWSDIIGSDTMVGTFVVNGIRFSATSTEASATSLKMPTIFSEQQGQRVVLPCDMVPEGAGSDSSEEEKRVSTPPAPTNVHAACTAKPVATLERQTKIQNETTSSSQVPANFKDRHPRSGVTSTPTNPTSREFLETLDECERKYATVTNEDGLSHLNNFLWLIEKLITSATLEETETLHRWVQQVSDHAYDLSGQDKSKKQKYPIIYLGTLFEVMYIEALYRFPISKDRMCFLIAAEEYIFHTLANEFSELSQSPAYNISDAFDISSSLLSALSILEVQSRSNNSIVFPPISEARNSMASYLSIMFPNLEERRRSEKSLHSVCAMLPPFADALDARTRLLVEWLACNITSCQQRLTEGGIQQDREEKVELISTDMEMLDSIMEPMTSQSTTPPVVRLPSDQELLKTQGIGSIPPAPTNVHASCNARLALTSERQTLCRGTTS